MSRRRRSPAGRQRTQRQTREVEARLQLVKRTRAALSTLSTESLYRIHDLLEKALAEPEIDAEALEELERALG